LFLTPFTCAQALISIPRPVEPDILEKIEQEMPNLILEFLPTYSPDYNLIELVWHSAKEFIANRLFESIEELEALVNKLLNEGQLVINWGRNVKNKGNAVDAI
jgi:transposase